MKEFEQVPIAKQRREIYGEGFLSESLDQRADDVRRKLIIDYSVRPEDRHSGHEKRDVWKEEAQDIISLTGGGPDIAILDAGMSGGYLIRQLLSQGFRGVVVGVDIEAPHLADMRKAFDREYPDARIDLGIANAEKLRNIHVNGKSHRIEDNFFDVVVENFIHHHTAHPEAAIDAAIRVTKPGGHSIFAARAEGHLDFVYDAATKAAASLGLNAPRSYYKKYDFFKMKDYLASLQDQGKIQIIKEGIHVGYLWIDGNEELDSGKQGRKDFSNAVMALLPDMNRGKAEKVTPRVLQDFIDNLLFPGYIDGAIRFYNGYILDYVAQKYFEVQVLE